MLYVKFSKIDSQPYFRIDMEKEYPLPIEFKIGLSGHPSEILYTRNFTKENLIELQFDKENSTLYDISLLGIQETEIPNVSFNDLSLSSDEYYACLIESDKSKVIDDQRLEILRDHNSFVILWSGNKLSSLEFFAIAPKILVGINKENTLSAVLFKNLEPEYISGIFSE